MPRLQVAAVPVFEFGSPAGGSAGEATVLEFDVKQGGQIAATLVADDEDLVISLQAQGEDTDTYADLAATEHGLAGADLAVQAKTERHVAFNLRSNDDKFRVRVYSTNGGQGSIQMRGAEILSIDQLGRTL